MLRLQKTFDYTTFIYHHSTSKGYNNRLSKIEDSRLYINEDQEAKYENKSLDTLKYILFWNSYFGDSSFNLQKVTNT